MYILCFGKYMNIAHHSDYLLITDVMSVMIQNTALYNCKNGSGVNFSYLNTGRLNYQDRCRHQESDVRV